MLSWQFIKNHLFGTILVLSIIPTSFAQIPGISETINLQEVTTKMEQSQGIDKIKAFIETGDYYYNQADFSFALSHYQSALIFSQKIRHNQLTLTCLYRIGLIYQVIEKYKEANDYQIEALKIAELTNQHPEIIQTNYQIGSNYLIMSNYELALVYFLQALDVAKNTNDNAYQMSLYFKIGELHHLIHNYKKADEYFKSSLNLAKELKDTEKEAKNLDFLGKNSQACQEYNEALLYHQQALVKWEELSDILQQAKSKEQIGNSYLSLKNYNEALTYFFEALETYKLNLSNTNSLQISQSIASLYLEQNNTDSALVYLNQSLEFNKKIQNTQLRANNYKLFAEYYSIKEEYQKSLENYKRYIMIQDSVLDAERIREMARIQLLFENESQRQDYIELQEDFRGLQEIQNLKDTNRLNTIYTLSTVIILGILLLFVVYNRSRLKGKLYQELEYKVSERTEDLQNLAQKLSQTNEELDTFLYKASHDLQGPVATLDGLVNLGLKETENESILLYFNRQKTILKGMELLLFKIIEIGEIRNHQIRKEDVFLKKYLRRMLRSMSRMEGYKNVSLRLDVPDDVATFTDLEMLDITLDNTLRNAIFYSYKSGMSSPQITVNAEKDSRNTIIRVIDNGEGIPNNIQHKVFDMFFRGSNHSTGFGLGLYKAKIAIQKVNGNIYLESSEPGHTAFIIEIPH